MEHCRQILQQGLQSLNIPVSDKQLDTLLAFIKLIEKWNKAYNLTAVRNLEDMARIHILDSLAVLPYIEGKRIADIGTGAGLPGIPLAIFLPDVEFTLVDSNSKKTRFVQQAILELKLKNVNVIHSRVENIQADMLFSTVIMRAFASIQEIISLTSRLIDSSGILLAMKGQKPTDELNSISNEYSIISIKIPELEAERCLIRIKGKLNNG
ncbi:MAG: 16S rRNA (guanine(527)-N(7))-methyltransferase RsmG [Methylococcales bacterium]|nr:16S rRNA (guanine(527)-N(7))-methyltransferase RsmG [Methylococcales bacterium]